MFFAVCYMHDYFQEQPLPGLLLLIISVYGFPLCVLFTCLACITVLMHDHPFLSFNGLCAAVCVSVCVSMCVCIVQVKLGFSGGCGCPPFLQVTCFTGQHSLIFPRSEAIREEMGPPAI